ncbi:MAG: hypothetical protein M3P53_10855 [Actinomycetota bacterium]|nr:hypothetical protein [Actinomycetota bacterium]
MSEHRLHLHATGEGLDTTDFLWADDPLASFRTNLTAGLSEFPAGRRANRDFLRFAVLVFLVDRTRRRPKRWARDLRLDIPMERPKAWIPHSVDLERMLGFLTGDRWALQFHFAKRPVGSLGATPCPTANDYMLLSGGADSLTGALLLADPTRTCLISHSAAGQHDVVDALGDLWGHRPTHFVRYVKRKRTDAAGKHFGDERSSRSRSLLFFALGLLAGSAAKAPLLVPENGFASLNPPMAPERSGSLSTRTTHPWYLFELRRILGEVGAHADLANPFGDKTKGEMFVDVATKYGAESASTILSVSHSCSRGNVKFHAPSGVRHCGVCYGCLVRRAAFAASGLVDHTLYLAEVTAPIGAGNGWLTHKARRDVAVAEYATRIGTIDPADIIAMGLPPTTDVDEAINLAQRGLDELKLLF